MGDDLVGTLVTDCYGGYEAQNAGAKQKCLAHLARTARDWQKLTSLGTPDFAGDGLASIAAVARQLELKSLTVRDLVTGKSFLIEF